MSELNERAKRQIALLAGDDLEGEQSLLARQSIDACPDCHQHWTRLRGCLDVLERTSRIPEPASEPSLWPAIERRLRSSVPMRAPQKFNGWVPALSMAAACIALLIVGRIDGTVPVDEFATSHFALSQEAPVVPTSSRHVYSGLQFDVRRTSPQLVNQIRMHFGNFEGFAGTNGEPTPTIPMSWNYQSSGQ